MSATDPLEGIDLNQIWAPVPPSTHTTRSSTSTLTVADLLRTKRRLEAQGKRHWTGHEKAQWVQEFPEGPFPWDRTEIEVQISVSTQNAAAAFKTISEAVTKMADSINQATGGVIALGAAVRARR